MMLAQANFLILDEPTNHLDMESIESLNLALENYPGTLIFVSHDRQFIDNTVTSTLVFEGPGLINEYVGGYQDWLRQRSVEETPPATVVAVKKTKRSADKRGPEQKELRALPGKIEKLEAKIEKLHLNISAVDYYQQDAALISSEQRQLQALESELQDLYQRWEELESE